MQIKTKFNIGDKAYYVLFGQIKSGFIEQILVKNNVIQYKFNYDYSFPILEEHVSYVEDDLLIQVKNYKIQELKQKRINLENLIKRDEEQIRRNKSTLVSIDHELKELDSAKS